MQKADHHHHHHNGRRSNGGWQLLSACLSVNSNKETISAAVAEGTQASRRAKKKHLALGYGKQRRLLRGGDACTNP